MNVPNKAAGAIFDAAIELPLEERAAYVQQACAGDEALRQRVEALLRANESAGTFMGTLAVNLDHGVPAAKSANQTGDKIGRYKLLQKIGEGGCGMVYMAEQEEPVRRRVALKIIKLGMDTKSVIARFEAERQALALMDHPNIAKVHDAGATDTGRPYFVMELVRGTKITDYCDEKNLSTQERLDLFVQVCHAVQHAHQKGIIHRDLKPSNILVNIVDGLPVPKVIDFGIAKATNDQRLTDKTVFTAFEQFIGTPAYMSPEQAEISGVDVDTRSDIYSLGVLLYELLTGKTPFDASELLKIGLDEMRRTIREKEPARPSTKVSRLRGEELARTANGRGVEAPKLVNVLRGDLDWIVMKCLEKDRGQRYETANGLATDIQRHLSNEPVTACPPSHVYRFQKMVRRNKVLFAATACTLCALVLGLCVATWGLVRERTARKRAVAAEKQAQADRANTQAALNKSEQVKYFFEKMLEGVGPEVAMGHDITILQEVLDKAAAEIGIELHDQPDVELYLRERIGMAYIDLGLSEKAEATLRLALALARQSNQPEHIVSALDLLAFTLVTYQHRTEEAETMLRDNVGILKEHPEIERRDSKLATELGALGRTLRVEGKLQEAEVFVLQSLEFQRKASGTNSFAVAAALNNCGATLVSEGKLDQAEAMFRESIDTHSRNGLSYDNLSMANLLHNLAVTLERQGRLEEAESGFRQYLETKNKVEGSRPDGSPDLAIHYDFLRDVLLKEHKAQEAEKLRKETIATLREKAKALAARTANMDLLRTRGGIFGRLGRWQDGLEDLGRVHEMCPADYDVSHQMAALLAQKGDLQGYRYLCSQVLERFGKTGDFTAGANVAETCLFVAPGVDIAKAARLADSACTLGRSSPFFGWYLFSSALSEYRQGHFDNAIDWGARTQARAADSRAPLYMTAVRSDVAMLQAKTYAVQAMAYHQLGQTNLAQGHLTKGLETLAEAGPEDFGNAWADWIIANLLLEEARNLIYGKGPGPNLTDSQSRLHVPADFPTRSEPTVGGNQPKSE